MPSKLSYKIFFVFEFFIQIHVNVTGFTIRKYIMQFIFISWMSFISIFARLYAI